MKKETLLRSCIDFNTLKENSIDMSGYIKNYYQVKQERDDFVSWIKYNDGTGMRDLDPTPFVTTIDLMVKLFDKLPGNPCDVDIRGVRIIFGLEGNKVVFFYSPVELERVSGNTSVPNYYEYYVTSADPKVYDADLNEISPNDLSVFTSRYATQIRVQRYQGSDFYTLNENTTNWHCDTKAVIFSFQEIFELYHGQYACNGGSNAYDKPLYIYNGAANYRNNILNRWRRKHNLFMALEDIDNPTFNSNVVLSSINRAANLAHLCPPNCNPVYWITQIPCP